jgi:hypothetical protein
VKVNNILFIRKAMAANCHTRDAKALKNASKEVMGILSEKKKRFVKPENRQEREQKEVRSKPTKRGKIQKRHASTSRRDPKH